jgi:hypothetical protein
MRNAIKNLLVGSLLLLGTAACADLEVVNLNDADAERALATAGDVEALIAGSYNTWFRGVYAYSGPGMFLSNAAFQHNAPWANAGMEVYGRIPRVSIVNNVADSNYSYFTRPWYYCYRAIAAVASGLKALENPEVADELGATNVARAKAYGKFVLGIAHATVAVLFDRGFAVDETTDLAQPQEPMGYNELMTVALAQLDQAATLSAATSFTLPDAWMQATITNQQLAKIAKSFKARFRAAVARTPAERAAVNWQALIADVDAGVTEDLVLYYDDYNGWSWDVLGYLTYPGWTSAAYFIWGMADQSGNYQKWLDLALDAKNTKFPDGSDVLILTPDTRFPQGNSVTAQRTAQGEVIHIATASQAGDTWKRPERGVWRWSWYKPFRGWEYWQEEQFYQPEIKVTEMRLLKAEALFRTNNKAGAAAIINQTRTAAGLNATDANGTNSSCVPKLPSGQCGDLWEMLKWEKRIENLGFGIFGAPMYFDSRGWGDLWKNTYLQLPVPCKEIQVLQLLPCGTFGGPGGEMSAAKSTYSWKFEG